MIPEQRVIVRTEVVWNTLGRDSLVEHATKGDTIDIASNVARRQRSTLLRCESLILKSHWVPVVMGQFTGRIIGVGVHAGVMDGPSLCRMFNRAIRGAGTPRYLSSDHDPLFKFHRWKASLRILEVTEVKTVPYVPISHPFVERLIGTIRREYLDHVPFWTARDLERKLLSFKDNYNDQRSHHPLGGVTPSTKSGKMQAKVANLDDFRWRSHCRGLYQLPAAA